MKRLILTLALTTVGMGTALAQATATSGSDAVAQSAAQNAGNMQGITFNSDASGRIKNVPSLGGNGFYGSFSSDNCMVSGGGTAVVAGFGGSVVTPIRDDQCSTLRGVERTMQVAASIAPTNPDVAARLHQGAIDMLCTLNDRTSVALRAQGVCTETQNTRTEVAKTDGRYQGNDPIVLRRLGMVAPQ